MMKSKFTLIVFLLAIILFSPVGAGAQQGSPPGGGGNPGIEDLIDEIDVLKARLTALETTLAGVSRNGGILLFEGMNVQIVDGSGDTEGVVNGLGNLIIGYDEKRTFKGAINDKTGSHNLVVGELHNYSSYGGLVAGMRNTVSSFNASVSGGFQNVASGGLSSVSGGNLNEASGTFSSVSGGQSNTASGNASSVSGGNRGSAPGIFNWAGGGLLQNQ